MYFKTFRYTIGLLLALAAGCYSPGITNGGLTCAAGDRCPSGYQCIASKCWLNGTHPTAGADMGGDGGGALGDNGTACTSDDACANHHCVDGVCCDGACDGTCEACNVTGYEGICTQVLGPPVGKRTACTGSGECGGSCTSASRASCTYPPATTGCMLSCSNAKQSGGLCDGAGSCANLTTKTCGNLGCDPDTNQCKMSCTTNSDCVAGYYCAAPTCKPFLTLTVNKVGLGEVDDGAGHIVCGTACSYASYQAGDTVVLSAAAKAGYRFVGWSGGGCTGTGNCTVKMAASTTVTAQFVALWTLTVSVQDTPCTSGDVYGGSGVVSISASPSVCQLSGSTGSSTSIKTCTYTIDNGTAITATGTPRNNSLNDTTPSCGADAKVAPGCSLGPGGTSSCSCSFTMSGDRTIVFRYCVL